jgi:hypothetical protein
MELTLNAGRSSRDIFRVVRTRNVRNEKLGGLLKMAERVGKPNAAWWGSAPQQHKALWRRESGPCSVSVRTVAAFRQLNGTSQSAHLL